MFKVQFDIKKAPWLDRPNSRWNAGLEAAGLSWRQELQRSRYGTSPIDSGLYQRTGTLADKTTFEITEEGRSMNLISAVYLKYLLGGTGIFGPIGDMIRPTTRPVMAWQATANFGFEISDRGDVRRAGRGNWITARETRGTIWPGKKEDVAEKMKKAFGQGIRDFQSEGVEE